MFEVQIGLRRLQGYGNEQTAAQAPAGRMLTIRPVHERKTRPAPNIREKPAELHYL